MIFTLAMTMLVVSGPAAQANIDASAAWRGVEGTVWSNGSWYIGQTEWIKDGTGNVTAKFSKTPTALGLSEELKVGVKVVGGTSWSTSKYFYPDNTSQHLYTYDNGTRFQARYARIPCQSNVCTHGFTGQIWA